MVADTGVENQKPDGIHIAEQRTLIDVRARPLVLPLFCCGILWMIFSTVISAVATFKLQSPDFLSFSWLSYGRLKPASEMAYVYGWCSMAGMAISTWVLSRSTLTSPRFGTLSILGIGLWNLGLVIGLASTLTGGMRSSVGLEMPLYSAIMIFVGVLCVSLSGALCVKEDPREWPIHYYFILGGYLWFSWSFLSGNLFIACVDVTGFAGRLGGEWVHQGVVWVWLLGMCLGLSYFLLPRSLGVSSEGGTASRLSFWMFLLFASVAATSKIGTGPFPLWVKAISGAAALMLIIPSSIICHTLLRISDVPKASGSPSATFIRFGVYALFFAAVLLGLSSFRSVQYLVSFTSFHTGLEHIVTRLTVSMILFGGIYYIMPRLSRCEWISSSLIKWHFLGTAYAGGIFAGMLVFSGLLTGSDLNNSDVPFAQVIESSSFFLWGANLSNVIGLIASVIFSFHFLLMLARIGQPEGLPTLLASSAEH